LGLKKPSSFETSLESYQTIDILGEGGSGRVYLVHDTKGNEFALKCLNPDRINENNLDRFKNELNFHLNNTNPNILTILDHGFLFSDDVKIPFYVMDRYSSSLRELLNKRLDPELGFYLFRQILDGVDHAHQKQIFHRDLKPENILVDEKSHNLVIADFGIAHFSQEDLFTAVETKSTERLANFQYAAPEQRARRRIVDQKADIFSLGYILCEIFTGEIPQGTNYLKVSERYEQFSFLDEIIDLMIRQKPSSRPSSIHEVKKIILDAEESHSKTSFTEPGLSAKKGSQNLVQYIAEIDLSGRIDDLNSDTVICISAGLSYCVKISSMEKIRALEIININNPNWSKKRCRIFLFTSLIYLLIYDNIEKLDFVIIDPEYLGYEPIIKNTILYF